MESKKYKKRIGRAACRAACFLGALLFSFAALFFESRLKTCGDTALILLDWNLPDSGQILRIQKTEEEQERPVDVTAWRQEQEVTVASADLHRQATVSALALCGDSDLVLRGTSRLTQGSDGCLIDRETARTLFGSTDVEGLAVSIGGRKRIVRGLLYRAKAAVLYEDDREQAFPYLSAAVADTAPETLAQEFFARHGLTGRLVRMDILAQAGAVLCFFLFFFFGGRLLIACFHAARAARGKYAGGIFLGLCLCLAALFFFFAARQIHIPADLAPGKWSDFSFWASYWARKRESLLLLLLTEKQKPMEPYLGDFHRLALCAALSFLTFLLSLRKN